MMNLASQPWVGTGLGLMGLIAAIYFYKKSQRRPQLGYQLDDVAIVGGGTTTFPSDLEIRFANRVVPRVTSTKIVIWNSGNETFHKSQFVESDPFRIQIRDDQIILQANITVTTRKVNGFSVNVGSDSSNIALLSFEYLDPMDGAAIEIIHTDDRSNLALLGTLKGLRAGVTSFGVKGGTVNPRRKLATRGTLSKVLIFGGVLFCITAALIPWLIQQPSEQDISLSFTRWVLGGTGLLYVFTGALELWRRRTRYPVSLDIPHIVEPPILEEPVSK